MSFDDKKKPDIVIIDAIMNLMTTRQRDDEELSKYTKYIKAARDLCKEKYGGILEIPMLAQKESTWGSDEEISYKTVYASSLSILYLKHTDQMKYGSFIKKMAEDIKTGQENVYPAHIKDAQCWKHPMLLSNVHFRNTTKTYLQHKFLLLTFCYLYF